MAKLFVVISVAFCVLAGSLSLSAQLAPPRRSADACRSCHADFSSVLPEGHPAVKGSGLAACIQCHSPAQSGEAKPNGFSTRIHLVHAGPAKKMECSGCHSYVPGKSFGLIGQSFSWGAAAKDDMDLVKQEFASWANSSFTDHLHAKAMIDCGGCHGKELPVLDATVENSRCLACHGPLEQLAARSTPKDFPKRNPHQSHLGDIACTVCHHAHAASKAYCLDCHNNFKLAIPGAGQ
jgi:hypothetical protein